MEKEIEVVKSNPLVEASYRLTPTEQCIILSCVSQIRKYEKVTDQTMYEVSVSDYVALTGVDHSMAYRDIKDAAIRLRRREVRIYELPNGGGKVENDENALVTGWVQTVSYSKRHGKVALRFNHDMLPYLTNISKNFTQYKLKDVAKMSSSFGIRLYELLIEWKKKYKTEKQEVSLEWLKKIFQVEEKYKAIKDFKKYVLEPAITDVNTHSDLQVAWTQRKTGRKVTHLEFTFKSKKVKADTKKPKQRSLKSWKSHIEKNARAGESWEEASARLKKKKGETEVA